MRCLQTRRYRGTGVAAGIHDVFPVVVLGVVKQRLDARLREGPGASVKRFFLAPHDGLGVGVHVKVLLELLPGEWVQLLDARDGGVFETVVGAVLVQGRVDLTGAEDDALDLLGIIDGIAVFGVGDDPLELRLASEFLNW